MIQTDLNTRERERFISVLQNLSEHSAKAITALKTENDQELIVSFVLITLSLSSLIELNIILQKAVRKDLDDKRSVEFSEFIDDSK